MVELFRIKKILKESGLNAQFRKSKEKDWKEILNNNIYIPIAYDWNFLNYNTVYFESFSKTSIDLSLVLYHDNKPCGIWPLNLDSSEREPLKTVNKLYGGVVVPPMFVENFPKKSQRKVIKSCISFLNKILKITEGECWRTNELSFEGVSGQWHQLVTEMGGNLERVNYEMFVDLSLSIKEIRSSIRKSFRPLVSSGLKKWNIFVMDEYNKKTWEDFRNLHKKVAGRVTRSIDTWNTQKESLKSGNAFLVYILDSEGIMVGGGYFDMSLHECNYSVGSYDKTYFDQPLGHMILYQAILFAKERGKKMFYIGDRFYKEDLPYVTEKRVRISHFQQGFASNIFPRIGLLFQLDGKN